MNFIHARTLKIWPLKVNSWLWPCMGLKTKDISDTAWGSFLWTNSDGVDFVYYIMLLANWSVIPYHIKNSTLTLWVVMCNHSCKYYSWYGGCILHEFPACYYLGNGVNCWIFQLLSGHMTSLAIFLWKVSDKEPTGSL